jgi:hypothetical protein
LSPERRCSDDDDVRDEMFDDRRCCVSRSDWATAAVPVNSANEAVHAIKAMGRLGRLMTTSRLCPTHPPGGHATPFLTVSPRDPRGDEKRAAFLARGSAPG